MSTDWIDLSSFIPKAVTNQFDPHFEHIAGPKRPKLQKSTFFKMGSNKETKLIIMVIDSWIRSLKTQRIPFALKDLIWQFYDKWMFDVSLLTKLILKNCDKELYYDDDAWLFKGGSSTSCDQQVCIEIDVIKLSKPGEICVGVITKGFTRYLLEGLYGSLLYEDENNNRFNRKFGYANSLANVFITDMDEAVIDNGTKIEMILKYQYKDDKCCIKYNIDDNKYGEAWKDIQTPVTFAVIMKKQETEINVSLQSHLYFIESN